MAANRLSPGDTDSTHEDLRRRFLAAGISLSRIGKLAGFRIVPATDPKLPFFARLPFESQQNVVKTLETSCRIYREMLQQEAEVRNSMAVVWAAFRELGLVPPSDFFDKVGSNDVVQLYSMEGLHLFANFRFFDLCSYTLEEIYSLPWPELWSRSEDDFKNLFGVVQQVMRPEQKTSIIVGGPSHAVKEMNSAFKFELDYKCKCMAPLWDGRHTRAGYIVIESVEITSERDFAKEEEALAQLTDSIE